MKLPLPIGLALALVAFAGCDKLSDLADQLEEKNSSAETKYYANMFGFNIMSTYYLWLDEIKSDLSTWKYADDPVEKVKALRYKDSQGEVDKWTQLMEDCSGFLGNVTGNTRSFGFDFVLYYADQTRTRVRAVVTFTYADSPASKAGLRRGDIILTLDGKAITPDNYSTLLKETLYSGGSVTLGMEDGSSIPLTAVQMYENPVQTVKTLEWGGKRFGYLHFTSFTMDACRDLETAFRTFRDEGIDELVLDLRYNGGGYTLTSNVLASMIVPAEEMGGVFTRDIYNSILSELYKDSLESRFAEEFQLSPSDGGAKYTVRPGQVNPGIKKLWVITTGSTASASEALICGLSPYMDLSTVGECSYGKFCGGYLIQAKDFFESLGKQKENTVDAEEGGRLLDGWGIYVISSRYADKNGVTRSMPSGIPADYEASDYPLDGIQLGDPAEQMLSKVLELSTGLSASPSTKGAPAAPDQLEWHAPGFGFYIH